MDRNYIVELIKENRLQEAIKVIEKATKGSHLHNQIIMLSSSYSEYAQMNRSATQDFQTLDIQRAKITNSLLSFLDELSPEELAQVDMPKKQIQHTQDNEPVQTITKTTNIDPKLYLYGAGALLLLAIAYFVFSAARTENTPIDAPNAPQTVTPQAQVSSNAGLNQTKPQVSNNAGSNQTQEQVSLNDHSNQTVITGKNVGLVEFDAGQGQIGTFEHDGANWIEEANGRRFKFRELKSSETCVYLRDDSRGVTIDLNLASKEVIYSEDKGRQGVVLHKITRVAE